MKFDSIRIVLVATSHPGNIGSTARAMKTMGLSRLYLVMPKSFPDKRAFEMAAGADDLLQQAIVVNTLHEAIKDCHLVLGTSARSRDIALQELTPNAQALLVSRQVDDEEVAIVFGREHAGLTNDELLQCHYHIHIPSNSAYSSLNLAQAVQIIAYELRIALMVEEKQTVNQVEQVASVHEIEQMYDHLYTTLVDIGFIKLSSPKRIMQRLRRLFNRARLEHVEVNILRGILTHIRYALIQKEKRDE